MSSMCTCYAAIWKRCFRVMTGNRNKAVYVGKVGERRTGPSVEGVYERREVKEVVAAVFSVYHLQLGFGYEPKRTELLLLVHHATHHLHTENCLNCLDWYQGSLSAIAYRSC